MEDDSFHWMEDFDTRGIDLLLIILRLLESYGYTLDTGPSSLVSDAERMIVSTITGDMGWDEDSDWMKKKDIYETLYGSESFLPVPSFHALLRDKKLESLFNNPQFTLIDSHMFKRLPDQLVEV